MLDYTLKSKIKEKEGKVTMKITFVGTSHGVPEKNRFCSCYMIESGGKIYFVDAGAPAVEAIINRGLSVNDFRAFFATHVHGDHTNCVLNLASLMTWFYRESGGDFFFTEQDQVEALKIWLKSTAIEDLAPDRIRYNVAKAGKVFEDENIKVEYIPTKHMKNSYSILVTEGEKRVLFGGDFSWMLRANDVPEVIKEDIDLFICEMAHFTPKEMAPYFKECRAKKVVISHVGLLCTFDEIAEALVGKYSFDTKIVNDGDEMEI